MERLVIRIGNEHAVPTEFDMDFAFDLDKCMFDGLQRIFDQLCDLTDILGDEYDLDRLQVIMDAEQHGGLIVGYGPGDPGEPGELGVMEEVAADNVEVVRCRECTHYKICDEWENGKRMLCEIHHHSYLDHDGDNHFCSWGQRKIETVLPKSDAKDESLEEDNEVS